MSPAVGRSFLRLSLLSLAFVFNNRNRRLLCAEYPRDILLIAFFDDFREVNSFLKREFYFALTS